MKEKQNQNRCPACGEGLKMGTFRCPVCGLEGLDQVFLSEEAYKRWEQQVLNPHVASIVPQVFAGCSYGLVLTAAGDLYGFGSNQDGKICRNGKTRYDAPHLMARGVISAAAGVESSIYVTRDGKVHMVGNGELVQRFPGFTGAKAVYADCGWNRFWIEDTYGRVYCLGENTDGFLEQKIRSLEMEIPTLSGYQDFDESVYYWNDSSYWKHEWNHLFHWKDAPYNGSITNTVKGKIGMSPDYVRLVRQYGSCNIEIERNPIENKVKSALYFVDRKTYHEYKPRLYRTNAMLWEPKLFASQLLKKEPHRFGSRPLLPGEYSGDLFNAPGVKKVGTRSQYSQEYLCLQSDGTVELPGRKELDWQEKPVCDLAMGLNMVILACRNGEILWCDDLHDLKNNDTKCFRLPRKEQ